MKTHISYPITSLQSLKRYAKQVQKVDGFETVSAASEALAKYLGFKDWHQAAETVKGGTPIHGPRASFGSAKPAPLTGGEATPLRKDSALGRDILNIDSAFLSRLSAWSTHNGETNKSDKFGWLVTSALKALMEEATRGHLSAYLEVPVDHCEAMLEELSGARGFICTVLDTKDWHGRIAPRDRLSFEIAGWWGGPCKVVYVEWTTRAQG